MAREISLVTRFTAAVSTSSLANAANSILPTNSIPTTNTVNMYNIRFNFLKSLQNYYKNCIYANFWLIFDNF